MYRVAVIVNENETLHSVYADAVRILKSALTLVYGERVSDIYSFEIIDKFNVFTLFEKGDKNLFSFDSIFISTNACNNKEIYDELKAHKKEIENYIDDDQGNHHGVCVLNQQKLGGAYDKFEPLGFLPQGLSYRLIKRPEKSSFDGQVSLCAMHDSIVHFPLTIEQKVIDNCCSGKYNQFMPHKYRHFIELENPSAYEIIYGDVSYNDFIGNKTTRCLLLKSRIRNERVVISSMALDWAEHLQQLANIIIFVTEGINQFAFVGKSDFKNKEFNRLIDKAIESKVAVKCYTERDISSIIAQKENPHKVFIFSSDWVEEEIITNLWYKIRELGKSDCVFYHLAEESEIKEAGLKIKCLFSKSIRNSHMVLGFEEWVMAKFIKSKWRKSVWTYEYILELLEELQCQNSSFILPLYLEIRNNHYKISDTISRSSGEKRETINTEKYIGQEYQEAFSKLSFQSYDNVFNSTCSCCNVMARLYEISKRTGLTKIVINNKEHSTKLFYNERNSLCNWVLLRMFDSQYSKRISWQDGLTAIIDLYTSGYFTDVVIKNATLLKLFKQKISEFESQLTEVIECLSSESITSDKYDSNADIAKLIKFYFVLYKIDIGYKGKAIEVIRLILVMLSKTQKYNGEWKNISETTELALAVLFCREIFNTELQTSCTNVEKLVGNAISFIQQKFNYDDFCWLDDENTSAKALHSVVLYENIYSSIFNDFLVDAIAISEKSINSVNLDNNIRALDFAQTEYNKLSIEKTKIEQEKIALIAEKNKSRKLIRTFKAIVGTLSVALAISLLFIVCIFGILASSYKETLDKMLSENIAIILSTAIGLVVTTILTGVFQIIKSKLTKDDEDKK